LVNGQGTLFGEVAAIARDYSQKKQGWWYCHSTVGFRYCPWPSGLYKIPACRYLKKNVQPYDSVKVTTRLASDSPNGSLNLLFGGALGVPRTNITATAVAMIVPRDSSGGDRTLSNSMSYDSQLLHESTGINNDQVWQDLGSPTFGNMKIFHTSASQMPSYSGSSSTSTIKNTLA